MIRSPIRRRERKRDRLLPDVQTPGAVCRRSWTPTLSRMPVSIRRKCRARATGPSGPTPLLGRDSGVLGQNSSVLACLPVALVDSWLHRPGFRWPISLRNLLGGSVGFLRMTVRGRYAAADDNSAIPDANRRFAARRRTGRKRKLLGRSSTNLSIHRSPKL